LANYLRQAFNRINIPFNHKARNQVGIRNVPCSVEILHFVGWARTISKYYSSRRFPPTDDPDFAEQITALLNHITIPENAQYNAIFIDEAQDFRAGWIEYLFKNALLGDEPKARNLIISADDAQRIYKHQGDRKFSWASHDIPVQGRATVLRRVYRNSARVWMFAGLFLGNIGEYYEEENVNASSKIWFAPKRGFDPLLIQTKTLKDQIKEAIKVIAGIHDQGYSFRNVLILYSKSSIPYPDSLSRNFPMVIQLLKELESSGIPFSWIAESNEAKATFDWSEESVKVSTVHSAKGIDAAVVIVIGAEGFRDDENNDAHKLMYVALTRAREYLRVLYTYETPIVNQLQGALTKYEKIHSMIIDLENASNAELVI
jgi:superfamily I DNA/RNA helicase